MTSDKFDKELADLYQQRKADIVVPTINLTAEKFKVTHSPLKLLLILLVAGSTSFGIMAIINHFSTLSTVDHKPEITMHITEVNAILPTQADEKTVRLTKSLPPKPDIRSPVTAAMLQPEIDSAGMPSSIQITGKVTVKMITLPELTKPVSAIEPVLKVLPRYSNIDAQEGEVDLSYQVDDMGNTIGIKVLNSTVNKALQRSAKKALSKWQYPPNNPMQDEIIIRFKFTQVESH